MEKLLELGCLQQVYRSLKRALGDPEEGEDYWQLSNKIMNGFTKKYKKQQEENKRQQSNQKETEPELDFDVKKDLEDFLIDINDPEEGDTEEDWAISREIGGSMYQVLRQHAEFNVTSTVTAQAKIQNERLRAREEEELVKQRAAEKTARSVHKATGATIALKSGAIKLTPEDHYSMMLLAQQTGGAVDTTAQIAAAQDFDDRDEGIELMESEPAFLRGQIDRMPVNYRHHSTAANQGYQAPGSAFGQEIRRIQNQLDADELDTRTDMEKVAARQDDVHRMRKAAFSKHQGGASSGGGAGEEANQEAKPTPLNVELGETPQESGGLGLGIRSAKDVAMNRGGKLPPWMKPSPNGGGVSFGPQSNMNLQEIRASLPIYKHKDRIIDYVLNNRVMVLVGEPGSGKTTQIPQYMVEAGLHKKGLIGCTQPRRVAATSVAERVAEEYGCPLGEEVGFSVRFNDKTSSMTIIRYMTDGMLLREALLDETFSRYSIIILDEAHERGVNTDVLFGLIKKAMRLRPDLRLIVTSATLETEKFCKYFETPEPMLIPGRTFPVTVTHDSLCDDYIETSVSVVMDIHLTKGAGDILVFLTGEAEIENAAARLHRWTEELEDIPELLILPIYSALANEVQSKVFEPTPRGSRKVVLATNIAETSITIPNLYYVVDPGFCKIKKYNPRTGVEQLKVHPISQSQAKQRMGRAGRTGPGMCFRLYSEAHFGSLKGATEPEIQRCNLSNIVLTLKAVGVGDIMKFEFMDPPSKNTLVSAQEKLFYLGALDQLGNLTPFGRRMSSLPVEPTLARTLLTAKDKGCLPSVMIAVSMMMAPHIFQRPRDKQEEADKKHAVFSHSEGDQLSLVAVYNAWVTVGKESEEWARSNYINFRALREARESKAQLEKLLKNTGGGAPNKMVEKEAPVNMNDDEQHTINVRKALTAGYFFQAAERMSDGKYLTLADRREVAIHPSSAVYHIRPKYVVYHELIKTTREYMRDVMAIQSSWLVEVAPTYYGRPQAGKLTKKQAAERIDPKLQRWEKGNDWRLSKLRVSRR